MKFNSEHIYKPQRILYFIKPTEEEKNDFFLGIIPDVLAKYNGSFGTYSAPSLYILNSEAKSIEVIGIEYRPNDSRIKYPSDLQSIELKETFLVAALDTEDHVFDDNFLLESISYLKNKLKSKEFQHGIQIKQEPEIIQLSTINNINQLYIQAEATKGQEAFDFPKAHTDTEQQLIDKAYKDSITNYYNWNYIWPIIAGFGYKGIQDYCFVHFDVKDYKAINIVYGHGTGNAVLQRIVEHMKKQDWIYYSARCHNDNFAMMIKDMPQKELKEKLETFFSELSTLEEDPNYRIYYRCGVVPMRNTLLLGDRVADAGKQVQRMGNKSYETEVLFYTDKMHEELAWTSKIKAYLGTAIKNDEFLVYFQPKYDIENEHIHGAEALIRWKFHGRDLLPPARFIPVFENGGLISKLDDIVLHKVCQYLKKWESEKLPLYPISINLSRKRMGNPDLVNHLTAIVDSYGVDHNLIDFELTESAAYDNHNMMINIIENLKKNGFKISMDDFGTGYSTLSLLTTMPMDTIKIDKSFVDKIGNSDDNDKECTLIKNIIRMAKEMKFTCLTEGAESKSQIEKLKEFGCEIVQGFYYSKPLPSEEYEMILKNHK